MAVAERYDDGGEMIDQFIDAMKKLVYEGGWRKLPVPDGYVNADEMAAGYLQAMAQVLLREMPYKDYLKTQHWHDLRTEALERAGRACQLCNASGVVLNAHHRTYERRGREELEDLTVLCRDCHEKYHKKSAGGA